MCKLRFALEARTDRNRFADLGERIYFEFELVEFSLSCLIAAKIEIIISVINSAERQL